MDQTFMFLAFFCFAVVNGLEILGAFQQRVQPTPKWQRSALPVVYSNGTVFVKGTQVFYQTSETVFERPTKFPVLLLHGAAFSSQTWKDLGTLKILASQGFRPIAVDLPGYGKTRKNFSKDKAHFLLKLIEKLELERPVLVSPSMSGVYSIPFILKHSDKLRGYVAVAPTNLRTTPTEFTKISLPTLAVYGSWDSYGKRVSQLLSNIEGSVVKLIPFGSHPAYLDDPVLWHKILRDFLDGIYENEKEDEEGSAQLSGSE